MGHFRCSRLGRPGNHCDHGVLILRRNVNPRSSERYIRYLYRDVLTENDYEVKCAEDGGEAIRIYREFLPQLVILDVIMPGKEGIETITELRKLDPHIQVIAVTGGHRTNAQKYLEMMKNFGANRVFEKPVPLDQLIDAVDDLLFGSTAF